MRKDPRHPLGLVAELPSQIELVFESPRGGLFRGDCVEFLRSIGESSVDMVFADPPFNLGKNYGKGISDSMREADYLSWTEEWLRECVRVLKPGGALFLFNLPRWLVPSGAYLGGLGMQFRHWIAMRMPKAFPRGKRMSPAHYGCLYYTKGEPARFNKVYVPIQTCRHCGGEIRDYGGHRKALNAKGLNFMDVIEQPREVWEDAPDALPSGRAWTEVDEIWDDIPPVRHSKHKVRGANELAPLMLERLIQMSTNTDDIVIDPFGGSGTTYFAAEKLGRYWLGTELGDVVPAIRRLQDLHAGNAVEWERSRRIAPRDGPQLSLIRHS